MKRILIMFAAVAAVLAASALALAATHRAHINLRKTKVGKILVNGRGFTLYVFAKDTRDKNNCIPIPGCMTVWPAVTTNGKPILGRGVRRSLIGTITLPNGRQQVTYAHHPLYTYVADGRPGETKYIGVNQSGGRWYALRASGRLVKRH